MIHVHRQRLGVTCCLLLLACAAPRAWGQPINGDYGATSDYVDGGAVYDDYGYGGGYGGGYQAPLPMSAGEVMGYGPVMPAPGPMMPPQGPYGPSCAPPDMLTGANIAAPRFYGRVDWLFWDRHRAGEEVVLTLNNNGTLADFNDDFPVASTSDLKFDFESGYRVDLGYTFGPGVTLAGNYFNIDEWGESKWVVDTSGQIPSLLNVPFPPDLFNFLDVDDFYENEAQWFVYDTELRSAELNLQFNTAIGPIRHAPLIGFRWFRVAEGLSLRTFDDSTSTPVDGLGLYDNRIKNDLLGAQIGDVGVWALDPHLAVEGGFKAGFFGNSMTMDKYVINNGLGRFGREVSTRAAFAGEVNLGLTFQPAQCCVLRAGYTALVIDRLALAPDNYDTLIDLDRPIRDVNGTLFYHGVNVGGEVRY